MKAHAFRTNNGGGKSSDVDQPRVQKGGMGGGYQNWSFRPRSLSPLNGKVHPPRHQAALPQQAYDVF